MLRIAVTGAAGFIGGETVLRLADAGHQVFACDRVCPAYNVARAAYTWVLSDFTHPNWLACLTENSVDALVHCAGTSLVGPSVTDPAEYYDNNFYRTKCLLDNMREWLPNTRIIFSSSASVYGSPLLTPCHEVDPVLPISPYGQSKAMIEWMLQSYHRAYQLPYVAFRYFNACGADSTARHGPSGKTVRSTPAKFSDGRPFSPQVIAPAATRCPARSCRCSVGRRR